MKAYLYTASADNKCAIKYARRVPKPENDGEKINPHFIFSNERLNSAIENSFIRQYTKGNFIRTQIIFNINQVKNNKH